MPGEGGLLDQSEIEALFANLQGGGTPASQPATQETPAEKEEPPATKGPSAPSTGAPAAPSARPAVVPEFNVKPFSVSELEQPAGAAESTSDVSLIFDVDLNVRVELGRTRMYIEDVLKLREGSIVPLDRLAGDPVDIFVNGQLLARGEVLVLNDNFCVRISEIVGEDETKAKAS